LSVLWLEHADTRCRLDVSCLDELQAQQMDAGLAVVVSRLDTLVADNLVQVQRMDEGLEQIVVWLGDLLADEHEQVADEDKIVADEHELVASSQVPTGTVMLCCRRFDTFDALLAECLHCTQHCSDDAVRSDSDEPSPVGRDAEGRISACLTRRNSMANDT
jgi:phosphoserine phosphatase